MTIPTPLLAADINVGVNGCTLVDAIRAAEANASRGNCGPGDADAIATDRIQLLSNSTISLSSAYSSGTALPDITSSILIAGNGSILTRSINADPFRFFHVQDGGNLTINELTITDASSTSSGGVILAEAFSDITINDCILSNNKAFVGGVLHAPGRINSNEPAGTVSLNNSQVTGNSAQYSGGLSVGGGALRSLTVSNSTVSDNSAYLGGGISTVRGYIGISNSKLFNNRVTGSGGAVNCFAGTLNIVDSTLSANYAEEGGGAINCSSTSDVDITGSTLFSNSANLGGAINATIAAANPTTGTSVSLTNSTVSNNFGMSYGGGIAVAYTSSLGLYNSTLTNNTAGLSGGGVAANDAQVNLSNSIIANSQNNDDVFLLSGATLTSDSVSIIEESSFSGSRSGDPGLLPLALNGGPTRTHALKTSSKARNTGILSACPVRDQRKQLRDDGDNACDVGAIEFNPDDIGDEQLIVIPLPGGKSVIFSL